MKFARDFVTGLFLLVVAFPIALLVYFACAPILMTHRLLESIAGLGAGVWGERAK